MKRSTAKVVVFLLLGAIVNVAVAWGLVAFTYRFADTFGITDSSGFSLYEEGPSHVHLKAGIPMRVLEGGSYYSNGIDTNEELWMVGDVYLPLRLRWPGFAINTIFYAAMLWVVFVVPGMVRRRIRRRRGLCPACAYPIGASPVCTECGNQF